jgi:hypothetical protein
MTEHNPEQEPEQTRLEDDHTPPWIDPEPERADTADRNRSEPTEQPPVQGHDEPAEPEGDAQPGRGGFGDPPA